MGVPLREGRLLRADDVPSGQRVAMVDEDFARHYWPNGSALGGQLFEGAAPGPIEAAYTIMGVVGAVKQADVTESQRQGAVYVTYNHSADNEFYVVARTRQDPPLLAGTM